MGSVQMVLTDLREHCESAINRLLREPMQFALDHRTDGQSETLIYRLFAGDDKTCVCVQLRNRVRPLELVQIIGRFPVDHCDYRMIFTEYVSDSLAMHLRAHRIWFADAQGNAFMEIPGKLLIQTLGNRPNRPLTPTGQHFSAPGAKVLHYLLKHGPSIHATYRGIREASGVSIDKIGKLVRELEANGTLQIRGSGQYAILAPDRLLQLWVDGYEAKLRPALHLGYCVAAGDHTYEALLGEADEALKEQLIIGAEVAADALTHNLRPQQLRLYVPESRIADLRRDLNLAPSEGRTIELCKRYTRELAGQGTVAGIAVADPTFVYAELMADGDSRLAETAMRLRQQYLAWTL